MKALHCQLILVNDSANDIFLLPFLFFLGEAFPHLGMASITQKLCQMFAHNHHLKNAAYCSRFAL